MPNPVGNMGYQVNGPTPDFQGTKLPCKHSKEHDGGSVMLSENMGKHPASERLMVGRLSGRVNTGN